MDGSQFGGNRGLEVSPAPVVPEREWALSAGQVTIAVLVIVAVSELIGLLSSL